GSASPHVIAEKLAHREMAAAQAADPNYYAVQILMTLLEGHGVKNVMVDFINADQHRHGVRFTVEEDGQAGLASFFEGLDFMFSETPEIDLLPETGSVFFADDDGLFTMITAYLSHGAARDGTPLLEYKTYKDLHKKMLESYVSEIETPRWRADFARIAAEAEDVLPEDILAARQAFSDLPYPQSSAILANALHSASSAAQHHLRETPIANFQTIAGYSVTYDAEEQMTNFELLVPDLNVEGGDQAWQHLEAFVDDLECFPECARLRRTRYVGEDEQGLPVTAGYVLGCHNLADLLKLVDQYYQAYNLKGPDEASQIDPNHFRGENGAFEKERYGDFFNYCAGRSAGLLAEHPASVGFLPSRSFPSTRHAEMALTLSMEAVVPVSIQRIRDVVHTELGLPALQRNGLNLLN
ncbi:MAG: hypothetical protein AB7E85_05605, partial [Pseudobdellovibrionaceae bacterium]